MTLPPQSESARGSLANLVSSSPFHAAFRNIEDELSVVRLKSGDTLFTEGEPGDSLHVVVFGRLRAQREAADGPQFLGEIGRGESVGEMALLTGQPRSATVYAVRNTELIELRKAGFERMAEQQPRVLLEMARLIATRYQHVIDAPGVTQPVTFAIVPCDAGIPTNTFAAELVQALSIGRKVLVLDHERLQRDGKIPAGGLSSDLDSARIERTGLESAGIDGELFGWLDTQELEHDHLVYVAEPRSSAWTQLCLRQADLVLIVGAAGAAGRLEPGLKDLLGPANETLRARRELVLLYDGAREAPHHTNQWLQALPVVHHHHHIDTSRPADYERLARMLTGRATGLVLGGGGARGLAHIGVIRALEDARIPIDLVGGTSIGSILGGQYASGWDSRRMEEETRRVFVNAGSLNDYTVPIIALLHGKRYFQVLERLFGERQIEDLPLPYFCISTNLTRSEAMVHRSGLLRKWVSASMAVPGMGPPVFSGKDVLVDGGVLNNLPIDVMRGFGRGRVFACNVSPRVGPQVDKEHTGILSPWRVLSSRLNPFGTPIRVPGIANILVRAASLSASVIRARGYPGADLVFEPPIEGHKLLDWHSIDSLIENGYRSATTTIEEWRARARL